MKKILLLLLIILLSVGTTSADWRTMQRDNTRNGYYPDIELNISGPILWQNNFSGVGTSSEGMIIDEGIAPNRVYAGDYNYNFYALNLLTGAEIWSYPVGNYIQDMGYIDDNHNIYIQTYGKFYKLSQNGAELWNRSHTGGNKPPIVFRGHVFTPTFNGWIIDYSENGGMVWDGGVTGAFTTGSIVPALQSNGNALIISYDFVSGNWTLHSVIIDTGAEVWNHTITGNGGAPPVIGSGATVYGDYIYAGKDKFDNNGSLIWTASNLSGSVFSQPVITKDAEFITTVDGSFVFHINRIDPNTGDVLWSSQYAYYDLSTHNRIPVATDEYILFCSADDSGFPPTNALKIYNMSGYLVRSVQDACGNDGKVSISSTGIVLVSDEFTIKALDFRSAAKGSISGMKFNDLNSNGLKDPLEPGLANWSINLTNQSGSVVTQITNASGNYSFTDLSDGNYTVGEVLEPGWMQTAPATGTYNVTITGGNSITGLDFGNERLPPTASCVKGPNPSGKNIPPAKGGQRPDGFYQLLAVDILDPDPKIFMNDTGSGMIFGPFANGTNIKYTQAPGATPKIETIGGPNSTVVWHITGKGDAAVHAMNNAGINSTQVSCLVPPPPK